MSTGRLGAGDTAIQPTIFDAKADILTATAADTPARLAVGANDTILVADSAQSTGLKWSGNWQTWSPTIGNFTIGNGTANYRYAQIGKTVFVNVNIVFGSTTTIGDANWSLPVTPRYNRWMGTASIFDSGTTYYMANVIAETTSYSYFYISPIVTNGTYGSFTSLGTNVPMTWAANDQINATFSYEAA